MRPLCCLHVIGHFLVYNSKKWIVGSSHPLACCVKGGGRSETKSYIQDRLMWRCLLVGIEFYRCNTFKATRHIKKDLQICIKLSLSFKLWPFINSKGKQADRLVLQLQSQDPGDPNRLFSDPSNSQSQLLLGLTCPTRSPRLLKMNSTLSSKSFQILTCST